MGSASQDWSAIRQWSSRSCTTDTNNFESCCWDKSHDYDWFVCESMPEPETTTTTTTAALVWAQKGGDNEKCTNVDEHEVANIEACQAEAEAAGYSYYQFAANNNYCAIAAECPTTGSKTGTSWEWKMYEATEAAAAEYTKMGDNYCIDAGGANYRAFSEGGDESRSACEAACTAVAACTGFEWYEGGAEIIADKSIDSEEQDNKNAKCILTK